MSTLLGKRKRSHSVPSDLRRLDAPLTRQNIAFHEALTSRASTSLSETMASSKGAWSDAGESGNTALSKNIKDILETYRIPLPRNDSQTPVFASSLDTYRRILQMDAQEVTPMSKEVAHMAERYKTLGETQLIEWLELDYFGKKPEGHLRGGTPTVARDRNAPWVIDTIPRPSRPSDGHKAALMAVKNVPLPVPDVAYGYTEACFTEAQRNLLLSLNQKRRILAKTSYDEPLFPYFIQEWKSTKAYGHIQEARYQAARDGAAAVFLMHNLLSQLGSAQPAIDDTACFSLVCDGNIMELTVHWREEVDGQVRWPSKTFAKGYLDDAEKVVELRHRVVAIFNWGSTDRLNKLRDSLTTISTQRGDTLVKERQATVSQQVPSPPVSVETMDPKARSSKRARPD